MKSIGDIIFTLPAVNVVRANFPAARISFLVSREHVPLLSGFRAVDEVIPLDRARYRSGNPFAISAETFSLVRILRHGRFSLAIDFQAYGETAILTRLTGAPERWGMRRQGVRTLAYTRLLGRVGRRHPIDRYVALLQQNGLKAGTLCNEFALPAAALDDARRFCVEEKWDPTRPGLFVQPFTSGVQKDWPLEKYLAVARHFRSQGMQVLFGGGPGEKPALEVIRRSGFPVSAGVPLLTNAGLMKLCTVVVGGDTGLVHLAVALNLRVRMLMASADPGKAFPFLHPDWAITPPPGRTLADIEIGEVIASCTRELSSP